MQTRTENFAKHDGPSLIEFVQELLSLGYEDVKDGELNGPKQLKHVTNGQSGTMVIYTVDDDDTASVALQRSPVLANIDAAANDVRQVLLEGMRKTIAGECEPNRLVAVAKAADAYNSTMQTQAVIAGKVSRP